ncbi:hypothetical protein K502DRAFT_160018 [Neoconidiobolus thromboides FSU 785]|nr:hypothetical protein K502DRAFT_160018 [Neoconidiobolus thromboides FSU 785]
MLTYHMFNKVEEACGTVFDWNTTCEIVKSCSNANTIINYNYLFHCSLNGSLASIVIICLILLFLFFYSLYYSSEYFLATPLQRLVVYFNIDGPIAGVTLLSFANGAPDFFTSIAGGDGGDSNSGLNLVIGSVLGSGMFTTCLVFAVGLLAARPKTRSEGELSELVIINQTENESNKKIYSWIHAPRGFLVNLFIYCFGVSLVLAMCISRSVFIFYGLALICIYLLYLTFVIFPKVKGFLKPFHRNFYKSQTYPPQNIPQIVIQGSKENIVVPSNNEDILASPSNCIECQQQPNSLGIEGNFRFIL